MATNQQPEGVRSAAITPPVTRPLIVVVMGVSGSGKSTVAALLAGALGCQFQEGDDLHPPENVEKMHGGIPLTDAVAPQDRRGNRRLACAGRMRRADLLGAEAVLSGRHYRRPPRRGVGLPQRIARACSSAHDRQAEALHAGCPARQPVCDIGGAGAGRAPDCCRDRRRTGRHRSRNRESTRGSAARSEQARAARRDERVREPTTATRAALGIPGVCWSIGSVGGWPAAVR
jgi:energy-coupling factor transporter ATP-binding protein EcfA2